MKTFSNLIQEVQNTGRCNRCGACVSFCTAVNYGALGLDADGRPGYKHQDRCIECGICYRICPARNDLTEDIHRLAQWRPPMGSVLETSIARACDENLRVKATDGGVVTALLLHLLGSGRIDGAIVSRRTGLFQHHPHLARSSQEIIDAAGSYFDAGKGMALLGERYATFSPSIQAFKPLVKEGLRRIAFVGVPCQVIALRKMQALNLLPAQTVHIVLGLFCGGNYDFNAAEKNRLEKIGGFSWEDVIHINLRDTMMLHCADGGTVHIGYDDIKPMLRTACRYCRDYSAEMADLSFGGVGAPLKWTTVLARSPIGRAAFSEARGKTICEFKLEDDPDFAARALAHVNERSKMKDRSYKKASANAGKVHHLF